MHPQCEPRGLQAPDAPDIALKLGRIVLPLTGMNAERRQALVQVNRVALKKQRCPRRHVDDAMAGIAVEAEIARSAVERVSPANSVVLGSPMVLSPTMIIE